MQTTPENKERAERAFRLALIYAHEQNNDEDIECAITDLTVDLMHLADQYGMEPQELLERARMHWLAETD